MSIDASRLQISLDQGERWRRTLNITVPAEIVQAERQTAIRKLSSRVNIPGFRAGKVPASVVEKRFGPAVEQEVLDRVIGEAYRGALQQNELRPISEGQVGEVDYEPDTDLAFAISFDVAPSVELSRLTGFQVRRPVIEVGGGQVDEVIERLSEQHGTWEPREEGTPEEGDMVSVRILRLAEDADGDPRSYEFTLGKGEAIPDVEAAIRTLEVGGEGEFTVSFPDDFPTEERRGETDELRIFLDGRKALQRPDLDDDFAAQVGEFESMESLRARIREDLEKEAEEESRAAMRGDLLEQILAANPFEIPDTMVDQYIRSAVGGNDEIPAEELAKLREEVRPQAERAVKRFLVVDEIARTRELTATEDEVDERVEAIAERTGATPNEVYARLQKSGALERLEREITEKKVFEFLEGESTIVDAA
ncbi:MAG: trigger factor [Gemmatimonadota bacterium]